MLSTFFLLSLTVFIAATTAGPVPTDKDGVGERKTRQLYSGIDPLLVDRYDPLYTRAELQRERLRELELIRQQRIREQLRLEQRQLERERLRSGLLSGSGLGPYGVGRGHGGRGGLIGGRGGLGGLGGIDGPDINIEVIN